MARRAAVWWSDGADQGRQVMARNEVLTVPRWPQGVRIGVEEGLLIVTREGDLEDHVVEPGTELRLSGRGRTVAWALEPSRVVLCRADPAEASRRRALAPAPAR